MRRFALIGKDISYSLSPQIHSLIYMFFSVGDCKYEILDLEKEELENNFSDLIKEYAGFNVTVPYKNFIKKIIDVDLSPVPAINTLKVRDGGVYGYNTDHYGFSHHINKLGIRSKNALIIGAGGAMEAIAHVLCQGGTKVCIKCRTPQRAEELKINGYNVDYQSFCPDFIVNATGRNIFGDNSIANDSLASKNIFKDSLLADINLSGLATIYELSYNKKWQTEQLSRYGIKYYDGLDMLIYQAIYAAKVLYDIDIEGKIDGAFDFINKNLIRK